MRLANFEAPKTWCDYAINLFSRLNANLEQKADKSEQKANKFEQEVEAEKEAAKITKHQLQQLSLKFDALAFCIDSDPGTQAAIKNIKSSLETMTIMLAPGDTRYYLPLVNSHSFDQLRSTSSLAIKCMWALLDTIIALYTWRKVNTITN